MCRKFDVTGAGYAKCNHVYSLATDLSANGRPVFVNEGEWRVFSFHYGKWVRSRLLNML